MIYIGADHRGYSLKEYLKNCLLKLGYEVRDLGADSLDIADDYPDFAISVCEGVLQNLAHNRGILVCGSGHGMDMVANKYKGLRAALCFNAGVAKQSRDHENANVLVLASDWIREHEAEEIAKLWLETEYGAADRNERRLKKIQELEAKNFSAEGGSASGGK